MKLLNEVKTGAVFKKEEATWWVCCDVVMSILEPRRRKSARHAITKNHFTKSSAKPINFVKRYEKFPPFF